MNLTSLFRKRNLSFPQLSGLLLIFFISSLSIVSTAKDAPKIIPLIPDKLSSIPANATHIEG